MVSPDFSSPTAGNVESSESYAVEPHPALALSMGHFRLRELLASQMVCRQLRDVVTGDSLLWRHVVVAQPLNSRLTDESLLRIIARAEGKLESLALLDCWRVSDAGLMEVAEQNPGIVKLYIPGCTGLTADGVVRVVKQLSESKGNLKHLRVNGLCKMTREHLDICKSILSQNRNEQTLEPGHYSYPFSVPINTDDGPPIDVDICPKCKNVGLVFDCTRDDCRKSCRSMKNRWVECRGCYFCVARCENCGGCIDFDEFDMDTVCCHLLCGNCWLQRPKCNFCNRPYCNKHSECKWPFCESLGFVCEQCKELKVPLELQVLGAHAEIEDDSAVPNFGNGYEEDSMMD